jgi:hypothetical protein
LTFLIGYSRLPQVVGRSKFSMRIGAAVVGWTLAILTSACGSEGAHTDADGFTPPDTLPRDAHASADVTPMGGSCDPSRVITLSVPQGMSAVDYRGTTIGAPSDLSPMTDCGVLETGPEVVHRLTIPGTGSYHVTADTRNPETTIDTIVYIQTGCGAGMELACNDDYNRDLGSGSKVDGVVQGGQDIFIVVDSFPSGDRGPYRLVVSLLPLNVGGLLVSNALVGNEPFVALADGSHLPLASGFQGFHLAAVRFRVPAAVTGSSETMLIQQRLVGLGRINLTETIDFRPPVGGTRDSDRVVLYFNEFSEQQLSGAQLEFDVVAIGGAPENAARFTVTLDQTNCVDNGTMVQCP